MFLPSLCSLYVTNSLTSVHRYHIIDEHHTKSAQFYPTNILQRRFWCIWSYLCFYKVDKVIIVIGRTCFVNGVEIIWIARYMCYAYILIVRPYWLPVWQKSWSFTHLEIIGVIVNVSSWITHTWTPIICHWFHKVILPRTKVMAIYWIQLMPWQPF